MNILPEINVNMSSVMAKFSPAGIPETVRNNLRRVLPDLTKEIGRAVDDKLSSQLKSRTSLETKKELVENPTSIFGRVRVTSSRNPLLPEWIEKGTRPHEIKAKNVNALHFMWPVMGGFVFFKSVHHPGTKAMQFMETTFGEFEPQIVSRLTEAVRQGVEH